MFKYPVLRPPSVVVGYELAACVGEKVGPVGAMVGESVVAVMHMPPENVPPSTWQPFDMGTELDTPAPVQLAFGYWIMETMLVAADR
jgi:hypothetical protein